MTKPKKCKICRTNIGRRYCIRTNKYLCLFCCNELRVDCKCPKPCNYHILEFTNTNLNPIKVDSLFELYDLQDNKIRRWILQPNELFDGQTPRVLKETEEGRELLTEKMKGQFPDIRLTKIYEKILGIDLGSSEMDFTVNHEDVGINFLSCIAEEKWWMLPQFFDHKADITIDTIIRRLKRKKELFDLNYYFVYASGLSGEGESAFCSFELNHKTELSATFTYYKEKWMINDLIFGEIGLIYTKEDTLNRIAIYLNKNLNTQILESIIQAEDIFYLSANFQYLKGLFYALKKKNKEALFYFDEASCLEPDFIEAIFNQAFLYQTEKNLEKAREQYNKVLNLQPNHIDALNNLGTICMSEKDYAKAVEYFQKCLQIDPESKEVLENLKKAEEMGG